MAQPPDIPPIALSQASGVPFYRQIVDQMGDLIRAGHLQPATRLPSVRQLASGLLVSLITVRRAYAELETAGLLHRRQGQGTFVASGVVESSQRARRQEAIEGLEQAVARALTLGLGAQNIQEHVNRALSGARATPHTTTTEASGETLD